MIDPTVAAVMAEVQRLRSELAFVTSNIQASSSSESLSDFAETASLDSDERLVWMSPTTLFTLSAATGWTSQDVSAYVPDGVTRVLLNVKYRVDGDAGIANIELETRQHSTASYTQSAVKFWWGPRDTNGDSAQATVQVYEQGFDYRLVHTVDSGAGSWVILEVEVDLIGYWTPYSASDDGSGGLGGGILTIPFGGTGAGSASGARVNLLPSLVGNTGNVLAVNAGETDVEWIAAGAGGGLTSAEVGARAVGSL